MSAPESREGRLVPRATGKPSSDPQRPHSPVSGGVSSRLVRCQYRQDPHPLDDECVNVVDAWTDAELEAGLRRVAVAIDGLPPTVEARPPLPWSDPAADPIADIRAAAERAVAAPYLPFEPIFSPSMAHLYRREMAKLRLRDEIARRRDRAKRLAPMYAAYRRRARRRGRR